MSSEELQAKLEKSEAARQKLRASLNLLKEKALNTGELVKQHQALQANLKAERQRAQQEQAGREAAESALEELRREQQGMRSELDAVRAQAGRAASAAKEAQAQASAASRAQQAQLEALRCQVAGLEHQVLSLSRLCQQLQQGAGAAAPMPAHLTQAAVPQRAARGPDAGAVEALAVQLGELQAQYGAVHGEMQRWKAALGSLALLAAGSPPPEALPGPPEGAEGSIMLAPVRVHPPAAIHESNVMGGTVDQDMGEHAAPAALPRPGRGHLPAALSPRTGEAISPGGGGPAHKAPAAWEGAEQGGGGGGPRQRAVAALKAAAAAAGPVTGEATGGGPPPRLRSPTKRQRPAAVAQEKVQQAKQALAGSARAPTKRVRYEDPLALPPTAAGAGSRRAGPLSPCGVRAAKGELEGPEVAMTDAVEGGAEAGAGAGAEEAQAAPEPSLAVSANGLPSEPTAADRVAVQLGAITAPDSEASMRLVCSVAAELAQALLQEGCPLQVVLVGFETAVLDCAAPAARLSHLALHPPLELPATGAAEPSAAEQPALPLACSWFAGPRSGEFQGLHGAGAHNPLAAALEGAQARPGPAIAAAATAPGIAPPQPGPARGSYAAVWCSEEALRGHKLRWLLHCALQLDAELAAHLEPQGASACRPAPSPPAPTHGLQQGGEAVPSVPTLPPQPAREQPMEAAAVGAAGGSAVQPAPAQAPALQLCEALRAHLHRLVVAGCLGVTGRGSAGGGGGGVGVPPPVAGCMVETELCALAAATAGLCRLAGQLQAFRAFLHDLLSILPPRPTVQLPPLAAALEVWPEALPPLPGGGLQPAPCEPPGGAGERPGGFPPNATLPAEAAAAAAEDQGGGPAEDAPAVVPPPPPPQPAAAAAPAQPEAAVMEAGPPGSSARLHAVQRAVQPAAIHAALQQLCGLARAGLPSGHDPEMQAPQANQPAAPSSTGVVLGASTGGTGPPEPHPHSGEGGGGVPHAPPPLPLVLSERQPAAAAGCLAQLGVQWWGWRRAAGSPPAPAVLGAVPGHPEAAPAALGEQGAAPAPAPAWQQNQAAPAPGKPALEEQAAAHGGPAAHEEEEFI